MCSVISYLLPALFISASAQQSQWSPYMNFQKFQVMNAQPQDFAQDQQFQASEYGGEHSFGKYEESDGGLGSDGGHGGLGGHDFGVHGGPDLQSHSYPVHQHIHEENPEPIKHYKEIVVPLPKNVEFKVNHPILIPVPHPVPIQIPVPKAVVIPIIKEVSIPVEKSVGYPVTKDVHVPKIKDVPFEVVKHIIVPVEKPIPFKVPVYETIIHTKKGSHKI